MYRFRNQHVLDAYRKYWDVADRMFRIVCPDDGDAMFGEPPPLTKAEQAEYEALRVQRDALHREAVDMEAQA